MAFKSNVGDEPFTFGVSGLLYNSDVLLYDHQTESLWSQIKSVAITGPMQGTLLQAISLSHTTWRDWRDRYPTSRVLSVDTGYRRNYGRDPYPGYRRDPKLFFPVAEENRRYRRKSLVMGLEINGQSKAYPFDQLKKAGTPFRDELGGKSFDVHYDHKNRTARIIGSDNDELPMVIAYWFAWYAFHPDTIIYSVD